MKTDKKYIVKADDMTINIVQSKFQNSRLDSVIKIKQTLNKYGPMIVGIWGDNSNIELNSLNKNNNIMNQPSFDYIRTSDHDVLLIGWGTINTENYWILQNSWSENFGYNGFFGIKIDSRAPHKYFSRYTYVENIKSETLNLDQIKNLKDFQSTITLELSGFKMNGKSMKKVKKFGETGGLPSTKTNAELNTYYANLVKSDNEKINQSTLHNFCWASNNNWAKRSIMTPTEDQGKCGSCWLFASLSMIQASLSLYTIKKGLGTFNVSLSKQWVLNNMPKLDGLYYKNGCEGGNADMLNVIVNGFKGIMSGKGSIQHSGAGLIPSINCTYKCEKYNGTNKCFSTQCEDGPVFRGKSRKYTPPESPFIQNLKKFFKDNAIYIIIVIIVIVVIIIILANKK